ncbi:Amino acid transporter domain-containing protein [Rozella allomycis CSF55]|uniref:Amino acid transporter domain-containing protein n=1 Tax=Rozella allomycis (strain CSF55) TaxID=988480 RepID=A0A075B523_ROZAC|nr:Amino acid transporter domain-containing protein [Rozella allomycis CSF55]|eukprot:EPZ36668.1 Amino acid transporter domain-containing protein [Rozella allomycis CSF55]
MSSNHELKEVSQTQMSHTTDIKKSSIVDPESSQQPTGSSGMSATIFNIVNSAVGAGTVAIPLRMKQCGLVLGTLLTIFAAISTGAALHFLGRVGSISKAKKYSDLGFYTYGRKGEMITVAAFLLLIMAPLIAYHKIVGNYLNADLSNVESLPSLLTSSEFTSLVIAMGVILPLSLLKNIGHLAKASLVCLVFILYAVILVVYQCVANISKIDFSKLVLFDLKLSILSDLSVMVMAFVSHTTIIDIFNDMKVPTVKNKLFAVSISNFIATILYLIVGIFGYLSMDVYLKDKTPFATADNVLTWNPEIAFLVGRIAFAFMIAMTYPLFLFPTRQLADWIIRETCSSNTKFIKSYNSKPDLVRIIMTFVFIFFPYAISCIPGLSLDFVFSIFGFTAGSLLVYILPSLFFMKIKQQIKPTFGEKMLAYMNLGVGFILLVVGTTYYLINAFNSPQV